jgi:plastocyanin
MKIRRRVKILITGLLCAAVLINSGCSDGTTNAAKDAKKDTAAISNKGEAPTAGTEQPAKGEVQITIENFVFVPAEVTVAPGTKVTWINKDEAPHTATSVDKKFNSGGLDTDDKFSFVFNDKGEYAYFCALHPHMKATITVK